MARPAAVPGLRRGMPRGDGIRLLIQARLGDLLGFLGQLSGAVEEGPARVELVHDARVGTRRLRAALGLHRLRPRARFRGVREEVAALGHALGAVRDLDLLIGLCSEAAAGAAPAARRGLLDLGARLLLRLRAPREALRAQAGRFCGEVAGRLRRGLKELDAGAGTLGGRAMQRRLHLRRRRAQRRLRPALSGGPDQLHALRIALKKLRYHAELLAGIVPAADRLARELPPLIGRIGDVHDRDVRLRWIVGELATATADEEAGLLYLLRRVHGERRALWPAAEAALRGAAF